MPPARTVGCFSGSITLELIIAFAVLSLVLTSVILLTASSDALVFEREDTERAIAKQLTRESTVAAASTSIRDRIAYSAVVTTEDRTPCLVQITATATSSGTAGDGVSFVTLLGDIQLIQALGGDCEYEAATSSWRLIQDQSSLPLSGTSIDVLNGYAYIGLTTPPYFAVVHDGHQIAFQNGFALPEPPNALDAALVDGTPYVFFAMASSSNQFVAVNARDAENPAIVASRSLSGVNPLGNDPAAYRVRYFDGTAYVATRFISGTQPELHLFDVRDPAQAYERSMGNIGTTVHGMEVRIRGGKTYLYAATTHDARELAVYDVTSGATPIQTVDLPGNQDGDSLAIQGNILFLGRASNTGGPELYVFDITDPERAPVLIGTAEITSKDITAIVPVGDLLFISATNDGVGNRMLLVYDAHTLSQMSEKQVPGLVLDGIEYEHDAAYALDAGALHTYAGN